MCYQAINPAEGGMQVKAILNAIEKHAGFVIVAVIWVVGQMGAELEVQVRARRRSRPRCSGCGRKRPSYDRQPARSFGYVPLWGIPVSFRYAPRRVNCPTCGVRVEAIPWGSGKLRLTNSYIWFLARWAKRLSWREVAEIFHTSWDTVFTAVEIAVAWGRKHVDVSRVTAIGVDEVAWQRGHKYLTLVYEIAEGCRRLLWVAQHREEQTLHGFFDWLGEGARNLKVVCSDMWQPYLKVIAERGSQAIHILDRFHIVAKLNKAVDEVRAAEARELRRRGYEPILTKSRWCLLKRVENLTALQEIKLADLLRYNLKTVRTYLLKEDLQLLWDEKTEYWAGKFLDLWCWRTMRSRIEPMKKIARSLRHHRDLILNWFRTKGRFSTGVVEGLNNKLKLVTRRAYGFRTYRAIEVALYHNLGHLPEPESTHRFC